MAEEKHAQPGKSDVDAGSDTPRAAPDQPAELPRIDGRYIAGEIGRVLNFDRGILYTIRELILRPGPSVQTFIKEDRNRLVKPILFLILCSVIYTLAQRLFHFEDGYIQGEVDDSAVTGMFEWVQNNYGYANILMGIFIGLWLKVLFRKTPYNIFEILILIFFTMGIGMLIYTVFGIFESLTQLRVLNLAGLVGIVYTSWAIGSFFHMRKVSSYLKAFFAYLLGFFSFMLVLVAIGTVIDLVTANG